MVLKAGARALGKICCLLFTAPGGTHRVLNMGSRGSIYR